MVARRFTKGDDRVEVAVVEAAENVLEGDDVEPRMQCRMRLAQGGQGVGEAEEGGKVVGAEGEGFDAVVARIVETAFGTLGNFQHLACITEKDAAGSGELDGAGAAFKEGGAELFFEVADLLAHRWVGDVKVLGGLGKVEVFGHSEEAAQLVGVHGAAPF